MKPGPAYDFAADVKQHLAARDAAPTTSSAAASAEAKEAPTPAGGASAAEGGPSKVSRIEPPTERKVSFDVEEEDTTRSDVAGLLVGLAVATTAAALLVMARRR